MIIGEYPCCNKPLFIQFVGEGRVQKITCPHCGAIVWHIHSRLEPESYTDKEFKKKFKIDEETHIIERRTICQVLNT